MKFEKEKFLPIYNHLADSKDIVEVGDCEFVITITPAIVKTAQGNKTIFPGTREKLIEKALRSFLHDKAHTETENDENIPINFSLTGLKSQLDKNQNSMTFDEIKEGLNVMRRCDLEVVRKNKIAKFEQTIGGPILDIRFQVETKEENQETILYRAYLHPVIIELLNITG